PDLWRPQRLLAADPDRAAQPQQRRHVWAPGAARIPLGIRCYLARVPGHGWGPATDRASYNRSNVHKFFTVRVDPAGIATMLPATSAKPASAPPPGAVLPHAGGRPREDYWDRSGFSPELPPI